MSMLKKEMLAFNAGFNQALNFDFQNTKIAEQASPIALK